MEQDLSRITREQHDGLPALVALCFLSKSGAAATRTVASPPGCSVLLPPSSRNTRIYENSLRRGTSLLRSACPRSRCSVPFSLGGQQLSSIHMATSRSPPSGKEQEVLMMAEEEMKHKIQLLNGIARTCFHKCVDKKYKDSELYIGEISCINRCVSKYVQVYNIIGQTIASNRPTL